MNTPIHWRLRQARYRLLGSLCVRCQRPTFPPHPFCPQCALPTRIEAGLGTALDHQSIFQYVNVYLRRYWEEDAAHSHDLEDKLPYWD